MAIERVLTSSTAPPAAVESAPALRGRSRAEAAARRALDVAFALTALLLLAPVLLVIALAVRLSSPGPAIFRQERLGRDMRAFRVWKFRTMRCDADASPHRAYVRSLIGRTAEEVARHGSLYKLAVDDRVTRVGRFLRGWSLDELPQLWNVVRGDMALVGPRPVIPYEVEQYPEWYLRRFAVKPGMTGLWQVSGRNARTYDEMVRFDIAYAEENSLWADLRILGRTAVVVLRREGVA